MNENGITVLSLFDGMSCGRIALKELGIKVDKYYASEIDKHAIKQTMLNFPDTIQLGSVTEVDARKLGHIDLLIGGSPCTNFSFAGRRNGMNTTTNEEIYTLERYLELKEQGFEFDGESFLFWEYMRILGEVRETNPNVFFFLENVEMGDKWETVLTKAIGIPGVHINSALVSAQNRRRIYWTNIKTKTEGFFNWVVPDIPQPEDRGIMITDEQIVKDWNIVKKCENCAYRGATTCKNSGDGPIHECWCHLTGNPGPLHALYGAGCSKWKLRGWIRENYEKEHTEAV